MITDGQLRALITFSLRGRQNAHTRAMRKDCQAALDGDAFCRAHCAEHYAKHEALRGTP